MVPTWTILGHNFVWVDEQGKFILKKVTVGRVHDGLIEVTNGLIPEDKIITDPTSIAKQKYSLL
jgi:hypothetical protein